MRHDDLLFYRGDLRAALQQEQGLVQEVNAAPEDHVLHVDEEAWAKALAERWSIQAPQLHPDGRGWMRQGTRRSTSRGTTSAEPSPTRAGQRTCPGHRTVVHIPFIGDKAIFSLTPSTFNMNPPRADVADGELRLVLEYPSDDPADIKAEMNGLVSSANTYLGYAAQRHPAVQPRLGGEGACRDPEPSPARPAAP